MKVEEIMGTILFSGEERKIILQLRECYIWHNRFWEIYNKGDIAHPFEELRTNIQTLIYMISEYVSKQSSHKESIKAFKEDMRNFLSYMFDLQLSTFLNDPERNKGRIASAEQQMYNLLEYIRISFEETIKNIRTEILREEFIKNMLKLAQIMPRFKEMRNIKEEEMK